jgi:hypothetical protein
MAHSHDHSGHTGNNNTNGNIGNWLFSRTGVATIVAVSVLGFLIYQGHGAHLLGYLPFALILLCPLMHIFMHGGHGGHGGHQHGGEEDNAPRKPAARQQSANAPEEDHTHHH